jgi:hypothetical protein
MVVAEGRAASAAFRIATREELAAHDLYEVLMAARLVKPRV